MSGTAGQHTNGSPWVADENGSRTYRPDFDNLAAGLDEPLRSGNWAVALDAWIARELRIAGFPDDEV